MRKRKRKLTLLPHSRHAYLFIFSFGVRCCQKVWIYMLDYTFFQSRKENYLFPSLSGYSSLCHCNTTCSHLKIMSLVVWFHKWNVFIGSYVAHFQPAFSVPPPFLILDVLSNTKILIISLRLLHRKLFYIARIRRIFSYSPCWKWQNRTKCLRKPHHVRSCFCNVSSYHTISSQSSGWSSLLCFFSKSRERKKPPNASPFPFLRIVTMKRKQFFVRKLFSAFVTVLYRGGNSE